MPRHSTSEPLSTLLLGIAEARFAEARSAAVGRVPLTSARMRVVLG